MSKNKNGFTLIELLVVIAIISLLSAVILVSLNVARSKASDTAVKTNLASARTQAEQFATDNAGFEFSYDTICTEGTVGGIYPMVNAAAAESSDVSVSVDAIGNYDSSTCNDTSTGWAIEIPLKSTPGGLYCVDYLGKAEVTAGSSLSAVDDVTCL
ncbi:MAG: type II secretion system protein [Patescibacteria group bacterium]